MALRNSHSNLLNLFDLLSHLETPPSGETGKTVSPPPPSIPTPPPPPPLPAAAHLQPLPPPNALALSSPMKLLITLPTSHS